MAQHWKSIYFLDDSGTVIDMLDVNMETGDLSADKAVWGCKIETEDYWNETVQLSREIDSPTLWKIAESTGFDFFIDDDMAELDRLCAVICNDRTSVDICWGENEQEIAKTLIAKLQEWSSKE